MPQRKRPTHLSPVESHNTPVILFITLAIQPRGPYLANAYFRDAFVAACGDADAWRVGFFLIMPDHVHLFARPARLPLIGIKRWSSYLKERVTKRLHTDTAHGKRLGAASPSKSRSDNLEGEAVPSRALWNWQSDCWDTQIRSGVHYHERWEYVRQNPVRANLAQRSDDWPWQGVLNVLEW